MGQISVAGLNLTPLHGTAFGREYETLLAATSWVIHDMVTPKVDLEYQRCRESKLSLVMGSLHDTKIPYFYCMSRGTFASTSVHMVWLSAEAEVWLCTVYSVVSDLGTLGVMR